MFLRVASTRAGPGSTQVTSQPRRANASVAFPVAQPTSRSRSRGCKPAIVMTRSMSSSGYSGRARWYRSAAASNVAASRSRSPSVATAALRAPACRPSLARHGSSAPSTPRSEVGHEVPAACAPVRDLWCWIAMTKAISVRLDEDAPAGAAGVGGVGPESVRGHRSVAPRVGGATPPSACARGGSRELRGGRDRPSRDARGRVVDGDVSCVAVRCTGSGCPQGSGTSSTETGTESSSRLTSCCRGRSLSLRRRHAAPGRRRSGRRPTGKGRSPGCSLSTRRRRRGPDSARVSDS